jgi:hypothetical protein
LDDVLGDRALRPTAGLRAATAAHLLRHFGVRLPSAGLGRQGRGLFAKKGLNVEPVQIRGGASITLGIMGGQLQFSGGAESVIAARVEGADVVLLACPTNLEPIYLITRPEIKSPAELKRG